MNGDLTHLILKRLRERGLGTVSATEMPLIVHDLLTEEDIADEIGSQYEKELGQSWREDIRRLEDTVDDLEKELEDLRTERVELLERIDELESELAELKGD